MNHLRMAKRIPAFLLSLVIPLGALPAIAHAVQEDVVWTNIVGATANGNTLQNAGAGGWGTSGALSTKALASGDGFVEFTTDETTTFRMCGLSNGDSDQNYPDIDYAFYPGDSGVLQIYEAGVYVGVNTTYAAGDRLRVAVEGGVVKYRRNGTLIFSSSVRPKYPLSVDTALYGTGATLSQVVLSGTLVLTQAPSPPMTMASSALFRGSSSTYATGVAVSKNGNIYVSGYVKDLNGFTDTWIAKFNSSLVLLASTTYSSSINGYEMAHGIAVDDAENVYVTGMDDVLVGSGGMTALWVAKFNSSLAQQSLNYRYGVYCIVSANGTCHSGYGVALDKTGSNVYVAGSLNSGASSGGDYLLDRWSPSLTLVNTAFYGKYGWDFANGVTVDAQGNVYTVGTEYNGFSQEDMVVRKFDAALNPLGSRAIGGNKTLKDAGYGIAVDPNDQMVYVTGDIDQGPGGQNIYVAKLDPSLNIMNEKIISYGAIDFYPGSAFRSPETGRSVAVAPNGTLYLTGHANETSPTGADIWVAKLDSALALKSISFYNGTGNANDYGRGVAVDANGDAYAVGEMVQSGGEINAWIAKFPILRAPASFSGTVQGASSITWTWSQVADVSGGTGYQIVSGLKEPVSGNLPQGTASYTETGLIPNTQYRRRVKAFDLADTQFSVSAALVTQAALPTNVGVTSITASAADFFWSPNGNPGGTLYRAEKSADGISFTQFYSGAASSVTVTGLTGKTYFRVRAQNSEGILTAFSPVVNTDDPASPPLPPVTGIPTVVTVSGRQLRVGGALFTVKGVDYSPTPVGSDFTYDWSTDPNTYNTDIPLLKAMGANTVRLYKPPTQKAAVDALWANGLYVIMDYPITPGINLSDPGNRQDLKNGFVSMVNTWKNHPAVLLWSFGNEVNQQINGKDNPAWYSLLQEAAAAAHAVDPNHPVTTANGGLDNIGNAALGANDASLPALDLWGATLYLGPDFKNSFTTFAASTTKPLLIMEWGRDAYNGSLSVPVEDQVSQSNDISTQWTHISQNLSSVSPANVCVGGLVFEYSDEWWKRQSGNQGQHDTITDWTNNFYSDPNINEEWWGLVSILGGRTSRNPRLAYQTLRSLWGGTAPITVSDDVVALYGDTGIGTWDVWTWPQNLTAQWEGKSEDTFPEGVPEGHESFKAVSYAGGGVGWGLVYDSAYDLNAYRANGALRFWIRTPSSNTKIEAQRLDGTKVFSFLLGDRPEWNNAMLNKWTFWEIDLSGMGDMSSIQLPFMATLNVGSSFYVDKVSYVKSKASPLLNVSIKNRADNADATDVTWPETTLPAGWVTANQYLRVDVEPGAQSSWGLQIYTDNKGPSASPVYTGAAGTNPAGLVDTTDPTKVLPLCWRVVDRTTGTVTIVQSADNHLYPQELGGEASGLRAFQWMKDKSTPDIPAQNTIAFRNGDDAIMAWDHEGFHYAEGDRSLDPGYWGKFWGAVNTPIYIYLGANFSTAITPRQYKTSTLHLELFTQ